VGEHKYFKRHVAVGNINLDISVELDAYPEEDSHVFARNPWIGLGGAATNYAIAVARLGHPVSLVARAGGDAVKLGLLDRLEAEGVDVEHVKVVFTEPMGIVVVLLVPRRGSRTLVTVRGANERLHHLMVPQLGDAGVYHFASVKPSLIESLCSEDWWRKGFMVTYDPGGEAYRSGDRIARSLQCIDILVVNEKEYEALGRAQVSRDGPRFIIVKRGSGGAVVLAEDYVIEAKLLKKPEAADVTGAGDAFDAAFNVWLLEGTSTEEALRAATAAGLAKVSLRGSSNMPSRARVEQAMRWVSVRRLPPQLA
jgi:ribokinase